LLGIEKNPISSDKKDGVFLLGRRGVLQ